MQTNNNNRPNRHAETHLRSQIRVLEKMVRELSSDLEETQKLTGVGTFYFDILTQKGSWTDQAAINYGLKPGTPIHRVKWEETIQSDDFAALMKKWEAASKVGEDFEIKYRVTKGDGSPGTMRLVGKVVKSPEGQPLAIRGIIQDLNMIEEIIKP